MRNPPSVPFRIISTAQPYVFSWRSSRRRTSARPARNGPRSLILRPYKSVIRLAARRLPNAASLITLLYGLRISDLGPFRAGRADVLRRLDLQENTYGWAVEIILKGTLGGFRIVEVPVSYYPRIGKSKISGTLKGKVGAAWFILSLLVRYYFRHRRSRMPRPA